MVPFVVSGAGVGLPPALQMIGMKKLVFLCVALIAWSGPARAALNLVPNGNFETAGGTNWIFGGGGAKIDYPASGGLNIVE